MFGNIVQTIAIASAAECTYLLKIENNVEHKPIDIGPSSNLEVKHG